MPCNNPVEILGKAVSLRLRDLAPRAYETLLNLSISADELETMLLEHEAGGGSLTDSHSVACKWAKANVAKLKSWVPFVCPEGQAQYGGSMDCQSCPAGQTNTDDYTACVPVLQ